MNSTDSQLIDLMGKVINDGQIIFGRNGAVQSLFGSNSMTFDAALSGKFPIICGKKTWFKGVVAELLWFMSGSTNIRSLQEQKVKIWDEWADEHGELGPVYGAQWRNFNGVDQLQQLVDNVKANPFSRRHIVSAWNPAQIEEMALPPCHMLWQVAIRQTSDHPQADPNKVWQSADRASSFRLDLAFVQRSGDLFLGVPFNISSYALLMHLIAKMVGVQPGVLSSTTHDAHLYHDHLMPTLVYMERGRDITDDQPALILPEIDWENATCHDVSMIATSDIKLGGYDEMSHPAIRASVVA